jgi:vacuolar-type H+-ATPase subunit I/STV1
MSQDYRLSRRKHDIELTQKYRPDTPDIPAVILTITSTAPTARTVAIEYTFPDSFPIDNLRFAKDWGGDYWDINTDEETITYARTIDPQMEVKTIIGFIDIQTELLEDVLDTGPTLTLLEDAPTNESTGSEPSTTRPETAAPPTRAPEASPKHTTEPRSPEQDSTDTVSDIHRELGALETRLEVVEEDIQGFGVFEADLQALLGDPTDPLADGQFEEMKEDLEILAELVTDLRGGTENGPSPEDLQDELTRLHDRIEGQEDAVETFRTELTDRVETLETRVENLETAHSDSYDAITDRLTRLEAAYASTAETTDQEASPDGG